MPDLYKKQGDIVQQDPSNYSMYNNLLDTIDLLNNVSRNKDLYDTAKDEDVISSTEQLPTDNEERDKVEIKEDPLRYIARDFSSKQYNTNEQEYNKFVGGDTYHPELGQAAMDKRIGNMQTTGNKIARTIASFSEQLVGDVLQLTGSLSPNKSGINSYMELGASDAERTRALTGTHLARIGDTITKNAQERYKLYSKEWKATDDGSFRPGDINYWLDMLSNNAFTVAAAIASLGFSTVGSIGITAAKAIGKRALGVLAKRGITTGAAKRLAIELGEFVGSTALAAINRQSESYIESVATYDSIYEDYRAMGYSDEEARRIAAMGAANTYNKNWWMLGQDALGFFLGGKIAGLRVARNVSKLENKALSNRIKNALNRAVGVDSKEALSKIDVGKIIGKNVGFRLIDGLSEGIEEGYQWSADDQSKAFAKAYANAANFNDPFDIKLALSSAKDASGKSIFDSIQKGLRTDYVSSDFWTSVTYGAVGGMMGTEVFSAGIKKLIKNDPLSQNIEKTVGSISNSLSRLANLFSSASDLNNEDLTPGEQELTANNILSELASVANSIGISDAVRNVLNTITSGEINEEVAAKLTKFGLNPEVLNQIKNLSGEDRLKIIQNYDSIANAYRQKEAEIVKHINKEHGLNISEINDLDDTDAIKNIRDAISDIVIADQFAAQVGEGSEIYKNLKKERDAAQEDLLGIVFDKVENGYSHKAFTGENTRERESNLLSDYIKGALSVKNLERYKSQLEKKKKLYSDTANNNDASESDKEKASFRLKVIDAQIANLEDNIKTAREAQSNILKEYDTLTGFAHEIISNGVKLLEAKQALEQKDNLTEEEQNRLNDINKFIAKVEEETRTKAIEYAKELAGKLDEKENATTVDAFLSTNNTINNVDQRLQSTASDKKAAEKIISDSISKVGKSKKKNTTSANQSKDSTQEKKPTSVARELLKQTESTSGSSELKPVQIESPELMYTGEALNTIGCGDLLKIGDKYYIVATIAEQNSVTERSRNLSFVSNEVNKRFEKEYNRKSDNAIVSPQCICVEISKDEYESLVEEYKNDKSSAIAKVSNKLKQIHANIDSLKDNSILTKGADSIIQVVEHSPMYYDSTYVPSDDNIEKTYTATDDESATAKVNNTRYLSDYSDNNTDTENINTGSVSFVLNYMHEENSEYVFNLTEENQKTLDEILSDKDVRSGNKPVSISFDLMDNFMAEKYDDPRKLEALEKYIDYILGGGLESNPTQYSPEDNVKYQKAIATFGISITMKYGDKIVKRTEKGGKIQSLWVPTIKISSSNKHYQSKIKERAKLIKVALNKNGLDATVSLVGGDIKVLPNFKPIKETIGSKVDLSGAQLGISTVDKNTKRAVLALDSKRKAHPNSDNILRGEVERDSPAGALYLVLNAEESGKIAFNSEEKVIRIRTASYKEFGESLYNRKNLASFEVENGIKQGEAKKALAAFVATMLYRLAYSALNNGDKTTLQLDRLFGVKGAETWSTFFNDELGYGLYVQDVKGSKRTPNLWRNLNRFFNGNLNFKFEEREDLGDDNYNTYKNDIRFVKYTDSIGNELTAIGYGSNGNGTGFANILVIQKNEQNISSLNSIDGFNKQLKAFVDWLYENSNINASLSDINQDAPDIHIKLVPVKWANDNGLANVKDLETLIKEKDPDGKYVIDLFDSGNSDNYNTWAINNDILMSDFDSYVNPIVKLSHTGSQQPSAETNKPSPTAVDTENKVSSQSAQISQNLENDVLTDEEVENIISDLAIIPYDSVRWDDKTNQREYFSGKSEFIDCAGRIVCVVDINGFKMPFYISTGLGGKTDVATGKWYPFFGMGADGWFNKTKGSDINNYYGNENLRRISEALDKKYGDIRGKVNAPKVKPNGSHTDFINQNLSPTENGTANTRKNLDANISSAHNNIKEAVSNLHNNAQAHEQSERDSKAVNKKQSSSISLTPTGYTDDFNGVSSAPFNPGGKAVNTISRSFSKAPSLANEPITWYGRFAGGDTITQYDEYLNGRTTYRIAPESSDSNTGKIELLLDKELAYLRTVLKDPVFSGGIIEITEELPDNAKEDIIELEHGKVTKQNNNTWVVTKKIKLAAKKSIYHKKKSDTIDQRRGALSTEPIDSAVEKITSQIGINISDVHVVESISTEISKGAESWGVFTNDCIYIERGAPTPVVYHEAFHNVSDSFFTGTLHKNVYRLARQYYNLEDASNEVVEERLADEFMYYMASKDELEAKYKTPLGRAFARLKNYISIVLRLSSNEVAMRQLFRSIEKGAYKKRPGVHNLDRNTTWHHIKIGNDELRSLKSNEVLYNAFKQYITYLATQNLKDGSIGLSSISNININNLLHNLLIDYEGSKNILGQIQTVLDNGYSVESLYNSDRPELGTIGENIEKLVTKINLYDDILSDITEDEYKGKSRAKRLIRGILSEIIDDSLIQHIDFDIYESDTDEALDNDPSVDDEAESPNKQVGSYSKGERTIDSIKHIRPYAKAIVRGLYKWEVAYIDNDGTPVYKPIINIFNGCELCDWETTARLVIQTISSCKNIDEMLTALKDRSKELKSGELNQLYNVLSSLYSKTTNNGTLKDHETYSKDLQALFQFWRSYRNTSLQFTKLTIRDSENKLSLSGSPEKGAKASAMFTLANRVYMFATNNSKLLIREPGERKAVTKSSSLIEGAEYKTIEKVSNRIPSSIYLDPDKGNYAIFEDLETKSPKLSDNGKQYTITDIIKYAKKYLDYSDRTTINNGNKFYDYLSEVSKRALSEREDADRYIDTIVRMFLSEVGLVVDDVTYDFIVDSYLQNSILNNDDLKNKDVIDGVPDVAAQHMYAKKLLLQDLLDLMYMATGRKKTNTTKIELRSVYVSKMPILLKLSEILINQNPALIDYMVLGPDGNKYCSQSNTSLITDSFIALKDANYVDSLKSSVGHKRSRLLKQLSSEDPEGAKNRAKLELVPLLSTRLDLEDQKREDSGRSYFGISEDEALLTGFLLYENYNDRTTESGSPLMATVPDPRETTFFIDGLKPFNSVFDESFLSYTQDNNLPGFYGIKFSNEVLSYFWDRYLDESEEIEQNRVIINEYNARKAKYDNATDENRQERLEALNEIKSKMRQFRHFVYGKNNELITVEENGVVIPGLHYSIFNYSGVKENISEDNFKGLLNRALNENLYVYLQDLVDRGFIGYDAETGILTEKQLPLKSERFDVIYSKVNDTHQALVKGNVDNIINLLNVAKDDIFDNARLLDKDSTALRSYFDEKGLDSSLAVGDIATIFTYLKTSKRFKTDDDIKNFLFKDNSISLKRTIDTADSALEQIGNIYNYSTSSMALQLQIADFMVNNMMSSIETCDILGIKLGSFKNDKDLSKRLYGVDSSGIHYFSDEIDLPDGTKLSSDYKVAVIGTNKIKSQDLYDRYHDLMFKNRIRMELSDTASETSEYDAIKKLLDEVLAGKSNLQVETKKGSNAARKIINRLYAKKAKKLGFINAAISDSSVFEDIGVSESNVVRLDPILRGINKDTENILKLASEKISIDIITTQDKKGSIFSIKDADDNVLFSIEAKTKGSLVQSSTYTKGASLVSIINDVFKLANVIDNKEKYAATVDILRGLLNASKVTYKDIEYDVLNNLKGKILIYSKEDSPWVADNDTFATRLSILYNAINDNKVTSFDNDSVLITKTDVTEELKDTESKLVSSTTKKESLEGALTELKDNSDDPIIRGIERQIHEELSAYLDVDPTDGSSWITAKMYRELLLRSGEIEYGGKVWNAIEYLEDDNNYEESDPTKPKDEAKYSDCINTVAYIPKKTMYIANDIVEENTTDAPKTFTSLIYDKTAMSVLFRGVAIGTEMEDLWRRMNATGKYAGQQPIDQVLVDSAVKVGSTPATKWEEDSSILSDLVIADRNWYSLREQSAIQEHEDNSRDKVGTAVCKIVCSNFRYNSNDTYTIISDPNEKMTAREMSNSIQSLRVALSNMGVLEISARFSKDGVVGAKGDPVKIFNELGPAIASSNGDQDVYQAIQSDPVTGTIKSTPNLLSSKTLIGNTFIKRIQSVTIELNLPGARLVQLSDYRFDKKIKAGDVVDDRLKMTAQKQLADDTIFARMECRVSTKLFKHLIPNYNEISHEERVKILTEISPKLLAYRTPTQGQSSIVCLDVVQFLGDDASDIIRVPREFTALTGSDFDIDKLFIAFRNYERDKNTKSVKPVEFIKAGDNTELNKKLYDAKIIELFYIYSRGLSKEEKLKYYNIHSILDLFDSDSKPSRRALEDAVDVVADQINDYINSQNSIGFDEESEQADMIKRLRNVSDFLYEDINVAANLISMLLEMYPGISYLFDVVNPEDLKLSDIRETLVRKGYLPEFEEFSEQPDEFKNTKKSMENRLLDLFESVLLSPNNANNTLVTLDSSVSRIKAYSSKVLEASGENEEKPLLSFFTPLAQLKMRTRDKNGKLGVGANALSLNARGFMQHSDLVFNTVGYYGKGISSRSGKTTKTVITSINAQNGNNISEALSGQISSFTDIGKDPFILTLNVNEATINIVDLMLSVGLDITTFYMMTQPVMVWAAKEFEAGSGYLSSSLREDKRYLKSGNLGDILDAYMAYITAGDTSVVVSEDIVEELFDKSEEGNILLKKEYYLDDDQLLDYYSNEKNALEDIRTINTVNKLGGKPSGEVYEQYKKAIARQYLLAKYMKFVDADARTFNDLINDTRVENGRAFSKASDIYVKGIAYDKLVKSDSFDNLDRMVWNSKYDGYSEGDTYLPQLYMNSERLICNLLGSVFIEYTPTVKRFFDIFTKESVLRSRRAVSRSAANNFIEEVKGYFHAEILRNAGIRSDFIERAFMYDSPENIGIIFKSIVDFYQQRLSSSNIEEAMTAKAFLENPFIHSFYINYSDGPIKQAVKIVDKHDEISTNVRFVKSGWEDLFMWEDKSVTKTGITIDKYVKQFAALAYMYLYYGYGNRHHKGDYNKYKPSIASIEYEVYPYDKAGRIAFDQAPIKIRETEKYNELMRVLSDDYAVEDNVFDLYDKVVRYIYTNNWYDTNIIRRIRHNAGEAGLIDKPIYHQYDSKGRQVIEPVGFLITNPKIIASLQVGRNDSKLPVYERYILLTGYDNTDVNNVTTYGKAFGSGQGLKKAYEDIDPNNIDAKSPDNSWQHKALLLELVGIDKATNQPIYKMIDKSSWTSKGNELRDGILTEGERSIIPGNRVTHNLTESEVNSVIDKYVELIHTRAIEADPKLAKEYDSAIANYPSKTNPSTTGSTGSVVLFYKDNDFLVQTYTKPSEEQGVVAKIGYRTYLNPVTSTVTYNNTPLIKDSNGWLNPDSVVAVNADSNVNSEFNDDSLNKIIGDSTINIVVLAIDPSTYDKLEGKLNSVVYKLLSNGKRVHIVLNNREDSSKSAEIVRRLKSSVANVIDKGIRDKNLTYLLSAKGFIHSLSYSKDFISQDGDFGLGVVSLKESDGKLVYDSMSDILKSILTNYMSYENSELSRDIVQYDMNKVVTPEFVKNSKPTDNSSSKEPIVFRFIRSSSTDYIVEETRTKDTDLIFKQTADNTTKLSFDKPYIYNNAIRTFAPPTTSVISGEDDIYKLDFNILSIIDGIVSTLTSEKKYENIAMQIEDLGILLLPGIYDKAQLTNKVKLRILLNKYSSGKSSQLSSVAYNTLVNIFGEKELRNILGNETFDKFASSFGPSSDDIGGIDKFEAYQDVLNKMLEYKGDNELLNRLIKLNANIKELTDNGGSIAVYLHNCFATDAGKSEDETINDQVVESNAPDPLGNIKNPGGYVPTRLMNGSNSYNMQSAPSEVTSIKDFTSGIISRLAANYKVEEESTFNDNNAIIIDFNTMKEIEDTAKECDNK